MVRRQREDFRVKQKGPLTARLCGESAEQYIGRVHPELARENGYPIPEDVFIRRRDGVLKLVGRFYDDQLQSHDGATLESVVQGVRNCFAKNEVEEYVLGFVNVSAEGDAKQLSLDASGGAQLEAECLFDSEYHIPFEEFPPKYSVDGLRRKVSLVRDLEIELTLVDIYLERGIE